MRAKCGRNILSRCSGKDLVYLCAQACKMVPK